MIHYYIIDLETTGLVADYNEITEISIIRCSDKVQLSRNIKCQYPERASKKALEVTCKTINDLIIGDDIDKVIEECHNFITSDGGSPEERCIIGHNIWVFDKKFLHAYWAEYGKTFPANLWLDTMSYMSEYAKKNGLQKKRFSLVDSMIELGLDPKLINLHTAKRDSRNNYILWQGLQKTGISQLNIIKTAQHNGEDGG